MLSHKDRGRPKGKENKASQQNKERKTVKKITMHDGRSSDCQSVAARKTVNFEVKQSLEDDIKKLVAALSQLRGRHMILEKERHRLTGMLKEVKIDHKRKRFYEEMKRNVLGLMESTTNDEESISIILAHSDFNELVYPCGNTTNIEESNYDSQF